MLPPVSDKFLALPPWELPPVDDDFRMADDGDFQFFFFLNSILILRRPKLSRTRLRGEDLLEEEEEEDLKP